MFPPLMERWWVYTSRRPFYCLLIHSAHWCAPCRQFTPVLRKIYLNLKKAGQPFEIVFCSKDSDQKGFDEYYGAMPWLAVDFKNAELRETLSQLFAVEGIPRLVMLSPEGVLNPNAKDDVLANENGFPWKQPTVKELVAPNVRKGDELVGEAAVAGKYVGLYFSAHWCGPCKLFTPQLIEVYKKLQEAGQPFEVVFCSLDNDEKEYKEYYGSMPWMTLGYNSPIVQKLKNILGFEGIPTLVLCNTEMEPITDDGVSSVKSTGVEGFPWLPSAVKDLNAEPDDINARRCLVAFMDGDCCDDAKKDAVVETLNQIAEQIMGEVSIFYVREAGDVSTQIRGMIQQTECPLLSIVDIPDEGGYYLAPSNELTAENILSFVNGVVSGSVERKQMVA